jgi:hypothetical protein
MVPFAVRSAAIEVIKFARFVHSAAMLVPKTAVDPACNTAVLFLHPYNPPFTVINVFIVLTVIAAYEKV